MNTTVSFFIKKTFRNIATGETVTPFSGTSDGYITFRTASGLDQLPLEDFLATHKLISK